MSKKYKKNTNERGRRETDTDYTVRTFNYTKQLESILIWRVSLLRFQGGHKTKVRNEEQGRNWKRRARIVVKGTATGIRAFPLYWPWPEPFVPWPFDEKMARKKAHSRALYESVYERELRRTTLEHAAKRKSTGCVAALWLIVSPFTNEPPRVNPETWKITYTLFLCFVPSLCFIGFLHNT